MFIGCHGRAGGGWWWVPLVATCLGALLGSLIYELLIEVHHPPDHDLDQSMVSAATKALELVDSDSTMNNKGTL